MYAIKRANQQQQQQQTVKESPHRIDGTSRQQCATVQQWLWRPQSSIVDGTRHIKQDQASKNDLVSLERLEMEMCDVAELICRPSRWTGQWRRESEPSTAHRTEVKERERERE